MLQVLILGLSWQGSTALHQSGIPRQREVMAKSQAVVAVGEAAPPLTPRGRDSVLGRDGKVFLTPAMSIS